MADSKSARRNGDDGARAAPAKPGLWNSLEIAKLIVASLTAVSVAVLGYLLTQQAQRQRADTERVARIESVQSARQAQVAAKRSELWDELGARLSRIHVAFNGEFEFPNQPDFTVVHREIRESEALLAVYEVYFPESFNETVRNYLRQAEEGLRMIREHSITNENYVGLRENYNWVLTAARDSIGGGEARMFRPPPARNAPPPAAAPRPAYPPQR
jgi:hypothetical protein